MSSWIQSENHFRYIYQGIVKCFANNNSMKSAMCVYVIPKSLDQFIKDNSLEEFINRLIALNVLSYNEDYGTNFKPTKLKKPKQLLDVEFGPIDFFKALTSLSYQIEYPEFDPETSAMLECLIGELAKKIIEGTSEFDASKTWGID